MAVEPGREGHGLRYDFFISYAHDDLERVRQLDRALRALLRRPLRRAGFRIFRDETGLAAGHDLTDRLRATLRESAWLLVVLTRASAMSRWVDREIDFWCNELGRADRLIIVRADPDVDLEWDDEAGRFRSSSSLPPALVDAVTAQPLYVEMPLGSVQDAAVRVAAAVLGRSPEDVAGADLRLHRRRRRLAATASSGLVLLTLASIAATALAVRSSREARRNETRAVEQEQRALADALAARALIEAEERPDKAFALAVAARRLVPDGAGESALLQLVAGTDSTDRFFRIDAEPTTVAVSPSGSFYAIGDAKGGLRLAEMGERPGSVAVQLGGVVPHLDFIDEDTLLAGIGDHRIVEITVEPGGSLSRGPEVSVPALQAWALNRETGTLVVGGSDEAGDAVVALVRTGSDGLRVDRSTTAFAASLPTVNALAIDESGTHIAVAQHHEFEVLDASTLQPPARARPMSLEAEAIAFRADGAIVAAGNKVGSNARNGVLVVLSPDGIELGTIHLAQSANNLARCDKLMLFGTRAGEYGWVSDPLEATRTTGDLAGEVSAISCTGTGGFVAVAEGGFVHVRTASPATGATAFPVYFSDDPQPLPERLASAGLSAGLDGLRAENGTVVPFTQGVEAEIDTLLAGVSPSQANCLSVALGSFDWYWYGSGNSDSEEEHLLGRCGHTEIRARGAFGEQLAAWSGDEKLFDLGATGLVPAAVAWSSDRSRLFVGGSLEGILYEVTDKGEPQELLRLPSPGWFWAASFVGDGDVLVTAVVFPPSYSMEVTLNVIGGLPLERLACRIAQGSLDGTAAVRLLDTAEAEALACDPLT